MKNLMMTTALVMFAAAPVAAQTAVTPSPQNMSATYMAGEMQVSADNLLGMNVYVQRADAPAATMDMTAGITDAPDTWDDVGEIGDVMLSSDGAVNSVVVDAGGFLGMGERNTRISMDQLQFVPDSDDADEFFVVYTGDRATIEGSDAYDDAALRAEGYQSSRDLMNQRTYATNRDNRETWETVDWSVMTTEDLTGVQVNGAGDNWVGEIASLVLAADGKTISHAVIDVGGWLGMGERPVALAFDQIELRRDADNDNVVAYVDATQEQLEAMPEYEG
jgi:hypothetical protein